MSWKLYKTYVHHMPRESFIFINDLNARSILNLQINYNLHLLGNFMLCVPVKVLHII